MGRPILEATRTAIVADLQSGKSARSTAKKHGASVTAVCAIRKAEGIGVVHRGGRPPDPASVRQQAAREGVTVRVLARKLAKIAAKVSTQLLPETVARIAEEQGVTP